MAKPNFGFQKRQKEMAREEKRREKQQRKLDRANEAAKNAANQQQPEVTGDTPPGAPE